MSRGIRDFAPQESEQNLGEYSTGTNFGKIEDSNRPMVNHRFSSERCGNTVPNHLDLKVMSVEYTENNHGTIIHVFGRDKDGERHHVEVEGHYPSFYITEEAYGQRIDNHYAVHDAERYDKSGERYRNLHGNPLVRIYTNSPESVSSMRDLFEETWEADVQYDKRWAIDSSVYTGIRIDLSDSIEDNWIKGEYRVSQKAVEPLSRDETPGVKPKRVAFDIEVAGEDGVPDADRAEYPVSTIVAWDSVTEEYVGWILLPSQFDKLSGGASDAELDEVRVYNEEPSLLYDFNEWLQREEPDILCGWFSNDFDIPYLINRCCNLNVYNYRDWSPIGEVFLTRYEPVIKGVGCVDMLGAYQKTQRHNLTSKKLDAVAKKELGKEKQDVEGDHTEMWRKSPIEFLKYNKMDVQLVHEIDESSGATALLDNLRAVVGCSYTDPIGGNFNMMDILFLREAQDYGYSLPTSVEPEVGDLHGGYVFTPKAGIHENVCYPDYSGLYPNIMYQCNISPETLIGTKEDLDESEYTEDDCVWTYVDMKTPPELKEGIEAKEERNEKLYFIKPSVKEGFIRSVLDDVMSLADQYTGGMYEAVKKIRNSCFTPDTDVLTPEGVKNITEIEVGDSVYSWNPDTNEMEIKDVIDTVVWEDYDGDVHHIDTNGIDLKLTPEHDLWVKRWRKTDEWEKTAVGELNEYTQYQTPHEWEMGGERIEAVDIREWVSEYEVRVVPNCHGRTFASVTDWCAENNGNGVYYLTPEEFVEYENDVREHAEEIGIQTRRRESEVPMEYDSDSFIKLLAWYTTEGHIYTSDRKQIGDVTRGECTTITISQKQTTYRDKIRSLLDNMGLSYYETDRSFEITGATALAETLGKMCGRGSYNKRLPEWVFGASTEQRQLLLDTLMKGDGDEGGRKRYSTASTELRDDVCRLLVSVGETPRYGKDSGVWRIRWHSSGTNGFRKNRSITTEPYDGSVYCLTVEDNHTVLAGRNGNFTVVGQCFGVMGDSDTYNVGFRLFDWRLAEGITLGGQRVLKDGADHFLDAVNEHGSGEEAYLVGGDTDSVMTSIPFAESGGEALDISQDAAEKTNNWLDGYTAQTFGLESEDDAMMELEVESYARSLFFKGDNDGKSDDGVKKRYAQLIEWDDSLEPCGEHDDATNACKACRESGWKEDPSVGVKGFEYVRSDVAQVTKDVQYDTFKKLMTLDSADSNQAVKGYVTDVIQDIMNDEYDMNDVGIPFGISQSLIQYGSAERTPQPQYRGAKYANKFIYNGDEITDGDKPLYYYIQSGKTGSLRETYKAHTKEDGKYVDAISILDHTDMPDSIKIDREKMIEKTIIDPMEAIFRTLDWKTEWLYDAIEDAKEPEDYRDENQMGFEELI